MGPDRAEVTSIEYRVAGDGEGAGVTRETRLRGRLAQLLAGGLVLLLTGCGRVAPGPLPVVAGHYPVHALTGLCPPSQVHTATGFAGDGQVLGYEPGWGILVGTNYHGGGLGGRYGPGLYRVNALTAQVTPLVRLAIPPGDTVRATIGDGWVAWVVVSTFNGAGEGIRAINLATGQIKTVLQTSASPGPSDLQIRDGTLYFLVPTPAPGPSGQRIDAYNLTSGRLETVLAVMVSSGREINAFTLGSGGLFYVLANVKPTAVGTHRGQIVYLDLSTRQTTTVLQEENAAVALAADGSTLALALYNPPLPLRVLPYTSVVLYQPGAAALTDVAILPGIGTAPLHFFGHYLAWTSFVGGSGGGVFNVTSKQIYRLPNSGLVTGVGLFGGLLGWSGALVKSVPISSPGSVTVTQVTVTPDVAWCRLTQG